MPHAMLSFQSFFRFIVVAGHTNLNHRENLQQSIELQLVVGIVCKDQFLVLRIRSHCNYWIHLLIRFIHHDGAWMLCVFSVQLPEAKPDDSGDNRCNSNCIECCKWIHGWNAILCKE
jgi:hypothetical protein